MPRPREQSVRCEWGVTWGKFVRRLDLLRRYARAPTVRLRLPHLLRVEGVRPSRHPHVQAVNQPT